MKFKCVIATTNVDLDGEQFTPEALQQLADTAVGKPLKWNFETDLPGKITKAYVENGQLWVEGESPIDLSLPSIQIEPAIRPDDVAFDAMVKAMAYEEDAHFMVGIGAEKKAE